MMVGVAGARSTIALAFKELVADSICMATILGMPLTMDRYLICTGYLAGKAMGDITADELEHTFRLNFAGIVEFCDRLFDQNERARVCVIGSESAYAGSYDSAYAGAKAALHRYVETKQLHHRDQMLVALAPHIILDANMTQARPDLEQLKVRAANNRLGRWLRAEEVALEAIHLLYDASPSLSGQVIRMRP